jgi:molybdopterin-containing oxidoreductase family iron-sulfur binding subunit
VAPEEIGPVIAHLMKAVIERAGATMPGAEPERCPLDAALIAGMADRLWAARGRSIVLCGSPDATDQIAVNYLNHVLGNYGATIDIETPSHQAEGSGSAMLELERELAAGKVDALFLYGVNPVYHRPGFDAALERAPFVVSFAPYRDETSSLAHYVCPDHHWLESWGDAEPAAGSIGIFQPAIAPLAGTRSVLESLAAWRGAPNTAHEIMRAHWQAHVFPRQQAVLSFEDFWRKSLETGVAEVAPVRVPIAGFNTAAVPLNRPRRNRPADAFSLVLYPKIGMLDGAHAYNPWLHELPDPVTKVTWDNYASLAPAAAARLGVQNGDVVRIDADGKALELPVLVQPGQHKAVVAIAIGYGRSGTGRFTKAGPQWLFAKPTTGGNGLVGVSAALLTGEPFVSVSRTGGKYMLASSQLQGTMSVPDHLRPPAGDRRPIVRELSTEDPEHTGGHGSSNEHPSLWPKEDHPYKGRRWGMVVDLTACTGCSACVAACQVENNIPVVGKDEVARKRAMHWMRIDRYYDERGEDVAVAHQPMMCQQCANAPCETVCPVVATVHSEEGLNQQVYNRCVGTRYCENNCPYKARRFNWFEYAREDTLANLVLNPDVTVRSRGVMEKCTFCVQRIQERKIDAKVQGRPLEDGEIQTACQQSCPAQAIVFGDLNDPKSRISQASRSNRAYRVLDETNVEPSVTYLALVRNRTEAKHG